MNSCEVPDHITEVRPGELVLTGGRHWVDVLFRGKRPVDATHVENFWHNFRHRKAWCIARGISYAHVVFPDCIVLKKRLLQDRDSISSVFMTAYGGPREEGCFYPEEVVAGCEDNFLKTDSHYSPICHYRLSDYLISETLGISDHEFMRSVSEVGATQADFSGDLGVQCVPPVTETVYRPKIESGVTMASNGMVSGSDGIFVLARNPQALRNETLLIFGDSFFRLMIVPLAHYFSNVVFCRTRFFHYEVVNAFNPTVIFSGNAERYFSSVPLDSERPHFFAYPLALGRGLNPDKGFAELWSAIVKREGLLGEHETLGQGDPINGRPTIAEADNALADALSSALAGDDLPAGEGGPPADSPAQRTEFINLAKRLRSALGREGYNLDITRMA